MELQALSLNFMLMYLFFCNIGTFSVVDRTIFDKFSPTLKFSPNPHSKSRFVLGKGNRWFNLQDWRWVRQCRAAFPEGSVPRHACPGAEAFPMPRSHWHEHHYVGHCLGSQARKLLGVRQPPPAVPTKCSQQRGQAAAVNGDEPVQL